MRNETFGLALTVGALLACAGAESTRIARDTYSIECRRSQANCYQEAANVCSGRDFDVLDGTERSGAIVTRTSENTAMVTPVHRGEMLVRCRSEATAQRLPPPPAPVAAAPPPGECVHPGGACRSDEHCCSGYSCLDIGDGRPVCVKD